MKQQSVAGPDGVEVRTDDDGLTYTAASEQQVQRRSDCAFTSSPAGPGDEAWDCPDTAPAGSIYCPEHADHYRSVYGLDE